MARLKAHTTIDAEPWQQRSELHLQCHDVMEVYNTGIRLRESLEVIANSIRKLTR